MALNLHTTRVLLHLPPPLRHILIRRISTEQLPRVAQPTFWTSLVPRFLRRPRSPTTPAGPAPRSAQRVYSNPWSAVVVLGLMVGSQAIHTLALKQAMKAESRKTEARLELLRGVIERVQRGEDVDVEAVLGTGNSEAEAEWWDVVKEIEDERTVWLRQKEKMEKRAAAAAARREARQKEKDKDKDKWETPAEEERPGQRTKTAGQVFV